MDSLLLFAEDSLASDLHSRFQRVAERLVRWDPDALLNAPEADIVDELLDEAMVQCPSVARDRIWMPQASEVPDPRSVLKAWLEVNADLTGVVVEPSGPHSKLRCVSSLVTLRDFLECYYHLSCWDALEFFAIDGVGQSLMRRLATVIAVGAAVCSCAAVALIVWHDALARLVGAEAYKTLLQFFLVVVLGGGISLLYQAFNRESDRRVERLKQMELRAAGIQETRQRYLRELVDQYNRAKRARRLLRATALNHELVFADRRVRVVRYDELMQSVLDAQLSLETMVRTMRAEDGVFAAEPELVDSVSAAEGYLRALVTEYEEVMPQATQDEIVLRMLPELAAFLGPYSEADRFRAEFVQPMNAVLAAVERAIAGPSLA